MSRKSFLEKQKENVVATYLQQQLLCCCRERPSILFFLYRSQVEISQEMLVWKDPQSLLSQSLALIAVGSCSHLRSH